MAHNISLNEFQAYLGTDETGDFITMCLSSGHALVDKYEGSVDTVPEDVHKQAVLIAASELYHRRSSPNGIAQFASMDGQPIRMGKDPLSAVYPLLLPWVDYGV